jgi:5-methylthioadenosine/S-adenosylhomocysteine deaminase
LSVRALRLRARWIIPISSAPIANGAVLVDQDGRIAAVGPDASVPAGDVPSRDLGDVAIMPGLVNAHTHLELMALRGLVQDRPFTRWITQIRKIKDRLTQDAYRAASRWGVLESFAAGITTIGDTGSSGEPARAIAELGARGVAFHEVFGPDPAQADGAMEGLRRALKDLDRLASERLAIGVSPHAPYTVSEPLLHAVGAFAREDARKVAIHVAESREERDLVMDGRGRFAEHLRGRGIHVPIHGISPVAWALRGLAGVQPLLIHCVHADAEDFRAIARSLATVAHCPASNAALDNGHANLALMHDSSVKVGLGTDSVAAGNALDLFAEARLAGMTNSMDPRRQLRLITADAADALGVRDVGRIERGAWGDLIAVLPKGRGFAALSDPEGALAGGADAASVRATWVAGRAVFDGGEWPGVSWQLEREAFARASDAASSERALLAAEAVPRISS